MEPPLASRGRGLAVLGVVRLKLAILDRLASSVLMEAARFLVIGCRVGSLPSSGGEGGEPTEDKGATRVAVVVSDPRCLATAAGGGPPGFAAMAERVMGPVNAGRCR
jgi:hypothetical protein